MNSFETLPDNLPVPQDDGACDHLIGKYLPDIFLPATYGGKINLSQENGILVLYCYPMTGKPGVALPEGWDDIPGARGCTPQSCAFRDHHAEISALGATIFGMSTQKTDYQQEMATRLDLPFAILSDAQLILCKSLALPTFEIQGMTLVKRITIIAKEGRIIAVHYPVFPSYSDPDWVLNILSFSV